MCAKQLLTSGSCSMQACVCDLVCVITWGLQPGLHLEQSHIVRMQAQQMQVKRWSSKHVLLLLHGKCATMGSTSPQHAYYISRKASKLLRMLLTAFSDRHSLC